MKLKPLVASIAIVAAVGAEAAPLRRLPAVTVAEGETALLDGHNAVGLASANTAIATVTPPDGNSSVLGGVRIGETEVTYKDERGAFAVRTVNVVPTYWVTLQKFFEDDPEVTLGVIGDKVVVSGKTANQETIRRVEQAKTFDPARILAQVTYSVPVIGATLQTYLRHIGYSNVTATAVGNEICLTGRLFDRKSISNVVQRSSAFLRDFPGIGVNADALKVFNQRIVLDVELIQYDVTKAENLGIQWPSAISAEGNFTYGWNAGRSHTESGEQTRESSSGNERTLSRSIADADPPSEDTPSHSVTENDDSILNALLNKAANGADSVERNSEWTMGAGASIDGVRMTVNLLKQNGVSKTLYKTSLATQSGEEATFQSGGTIHRNTQGTFSGGDLKEIDYGFIVKALPRILDDHTVMLTVDMDNKQPVNYAPGNSSAEIDITVTRYQTSSQYMVRPGETILVSGFNRLDEADSKQGLPWLGRIPWIGQWLFGNTVTRNNTSEVVLVVTINWALENDAAEAARRSAEMRGRDVSALGMP